MKPNHCLLIGSLLFLCHPVANAATAVHPSLLPWPQKVQTEAGQFALRDGMQIIIAQPVSARTQEIADLLRDGLRSVAGIAGKIEPDGVQPASGAVILKLVSRSSDVPAKTEAYTLRIAQNIEITAEDPRGLLWGVQTLLQAIDTSHPGSPSVAQGEIDDAPAYAWRAVMLDPVRSFLDLDFIRRTIRVMSAYKLNILHLHLTDDQAWRFETKAFPLCNPPGEPFYTQAELRELVVYAQRYGVEIIPEFDFPGHAHAAVTAYPELDCEGKTRPMDEAIFCAGKPFTWEFIDKVIAEAADIFPAHEIHLGADEPFAVKRWTTCPFCQARMKARGVTTTAQLYHTVVADLDELAKRHGKKLMVWNDAIHPEVTPLPPKDILIDAWAGSDDVIKLAHAGYTLVNSSNRPLYISSYSKRDGFPLRLVWQWTPREFGRREANVNDSDLKSEPLPDGTRVLGGQACAWATEQHLMERRLYPRLLAVAETLWSGTHRGDYAGFSARLAAGQSARLRGLGVPDDDALPAEMLFTGQDLRASDAAAKTGFAVADGVLHAPAGPADAALRSATDYRNFILTFERRAAENTGETGFFIRCVKADASAKPQGFDVRSAPPPGMKINVTDVRDLVGWNRFELVANGRVVSLTINGYLAWSKTDPSPRAGPIVLVGDGRGFEVRNIRVRSLDSVPSL